jgi:putative copper export protein
MNLIILFLHIIGASIWIGGHLIMAIRYIPEAVIKNSVEELIKFEESYEKIGMPALLLQIITGLYMAHEWTDGFKLFFDTNNPVVLTIWIKLALLLSTFALAIDARFRVLPKLSMKNLLDLSFHVYPVTIISLLFAFFGLLIRHGGMDFFAK